MASLVTKLMIFLAKCLLSFNQTYVAAAALMDVRVFDDLFVDGGVYTHRCCTIAAFHNDCQMGLLVTLKLCHLIRNMDMYVHNVHAVINVQRNLGLFSSLSKTRVLVHEKILYTCVLCILIPRHMCRYVILVGHMNEIPYCVKTLIPVPLYTCVCMYMCSCESDNFTCMCMS